MGDRVAGKVALVTGAGRSQGRSHAVRLAEEGADIIGLDVCADVFDTTSYPLATQEDLAETVKLVEQCDRRMVGSVTDVRDRDALKAAIDQGVAELGRLDIVVAQAGIAPLGLGLGPQAFVDVVDVNLIGVMNTVHAALPHLHPGASVIATGSIAAVLPGSVDQSGPGGLGYGFAKRLVAHYVNDLALCLGQFEIRVNGVHPTNVDTPMMQNSAVYGQFRPDLENPTREDAEAGFATLNLMPTVYVDTADVSNAVLYLASDESRYVTGMQLRVDAGGYLKAHSFHI